MRTEGLYVPRQCRLDYYTVMNIHQQSAYSEKHTLMNIHQQSAYSEKHTLMNKLLIRDIMQ